MSAAVAPTEPLVVLVGEYLDLRVAGDPDDSTAVWLRQGATVRDLPATWRPLISALPQPLSALELQLTAVPDAPTLTQLVSDNIVTLLPHPQAELDVDRWLQYYRLIPQGTSYGLPLTPSGNDTDRYQIGVEGPASVTVDEVGYWAWVWGGRAPSLAQLHERLTGIEEDSMTASRIRDALIDALPVLLTGRAGVLDTAVTA